MVWQLVSDRVHWQSKPSDPLIRLPTGADAGHQCLSDSFVAIMYSETANHSLLPATICRSVLKGICLDTVCILVLKAGRRLPISPSAPLADWDVGQ